MFNVERISIFDPDVNEWKVFFEIRYGDTQYVNKTYDGVYYCRKQATCTVDNFENCKKDESYYFSTDKPSLSWKKIDKFYIDNKVFGYGIPLSTANILKSASFPKVKTLIFDEFLIDNGTYHYLRNEVIQFLDVIETIARLRDVRVILLGNAITISNPYFDFFKLSLPNASSTASINSFCFSIICPRSFHPSF